MAEKVFTFEVIRAIAIALIITCHYCLFSGLNTSIGGLRGEVGNCMFFTLSALLFGLKWDQTYKRPFDYHWLMKRYKKIASTLYPFLVILILTFILFDVPFRVSDAILNFLFLGWIAKLPGNGHLWFLTVLTVCYAIFYYVSKSVCDRFNNRGVWITMLVMVMGSTVLVERFNIPGHAFPVLLITTFTFINAKGIIEMVKCVGIRVMILQFVVITTIIVTTFCILDIYKIYRPLSYLLYTIEGISIMLFLLSLNYKHQYAVVSWISSISFELYLVHHGFCQGAFSVLNDKNPLVSLVLLLFVSLVSVYMLKLIVGQVQKGLRFFGVNT